MKPRVNRLIWIVPLAILGTLVFIAIGGEIVLHLWNWLLPQVFGWRQITFWQAVGILALCRILFGGFGFRGRGRSGWRRRMQELRQHDPGGAGAIPSGHARTLGLRPSDEREQGAVKGADSPNARCACSRKLLNQIRPAPYD